MEALTSITPTPIVLRSHLRDVVSSRKRCFAQRAVSVVGHSYPLVHATSVELVVASLAGEAGKGVVRNVKDRVADWAAFDSFKVFV
jgi:hypothetical protein